MDILASASLFGITTVEVAGEAFIAPVNLSAFASLLLTKHELGQCFLESNASILSYGTTFKMAKSQLREAADLAILETVVNPNTPASAFLRTQSSVFIIPNVKSTIKMGASKLYAKANTHCVPLYEVRGIPEPLSEKAYLKRPPEAILDTKSELLCFGYKVLKCNICLPEEPTIPILGSSKLKCTAVPIPVAGEVKGGIALYAIPESLGITFSYLHARMSMDWVRNNTWKINEICRIQQCLLDAVREVIARQDNFLQPNDIQPLFDKAQELIYEVGDV